MAKTAQRKDGRATKKAKNNHLDPESLALMHLVDSQDFAKIEASARRILGQRPKHPLAIKALSFALIGVKRFEDAHPILQSAIDLYPNDPELHNNLGIVLSSLMRWEDSIRSFQRAKELAPSDPEILKNMGGAFIRMHREDLAVPVLLEAIQIHPGDYIEAVSLLADSLMALNRIEEAWTCFNELHAADQKNLRVLYQLIVCNLKRCCWGDMRQHLDVLKIHSNDFSLPLNNPFPALAFPGLTPQHHRSIAECFSREMIGEEKLRVRTLPASHEQDKSRLRIAYISGDLCMHPVGLIIGELIEKHNRGRVHVTAYSTRADDGSTVRCRLRTAFDHFVDAENLPILALRDKIRADQIDILIDLVGWTAHGRAEALALRCAPIQVNWLGYACSMGLDGIADYILGDPIATPAEHAPFYAEMIAQMPDCYLPADTTQIIPPPPSRAAAGLPEEGLVFCSFNNSYKYNPDVFDVWANLLQQIEGSILWLSHPGDTAAGHLRDELSKRNIDWERLIFAGRLKSHADHLARIQVADLALDTFPYNSHSTGIDTLRAGVPMIALLGDTFAGRVGASLLHSAGLDDLIASTRENYLDLALALARNPQRLEMYRNRLAMNAKTSPLFDMKKFADNLESVYFRMWQNYSKGERHPILCI